MSCMAPNSLLEMIVSRRHVMRRAVSTESGGFWLPPSGRIDYPASHNSPMMVRDRGRQAARASRVYLRRLGKTRTQRLKLLPAMMAVCERPFGSVTR
jgi:hypothetical protein